MTDSAPWLREREWAARELTDQTSVGLWVVMLAYIVLGSLGALLVFKAGGSYDLFDRFGLGGMLLAAAGGVTYFWRLGLRYGESVCRLVTLPGVIGGWLKADVECMLPPDPSEPVTIHLINEEMLGLGGPRLLWSMEQTLASAPIPVPGTRRSIVRVRIQVPRHPAQKPFPLIPVIPGLLPSTALWWLEIIKKAPGINFGAKFSVPIYDTPDAPASEQQPES